MTAYEGYLALGGQEIINNARAYGYTQTAGCPTHMLKRDAHCPNLWDALGEAAPYDYAEIGDAPWFDPAKPDVSSRFLGAYALRIDEVGDSTRRAEMSDTIGDGGVLGRSSKGPKEARVTALLIADGRDALEYAEHWLSATLDADTCAQHSDACGVTDLAFFADCPPERGAVVKGDLGFTLGKFTDVDQLIGEEQILPTNDPQFYSVAPTSNLRETTPGGGIYALATDIPVPYDDEEYEALQVRPLRRFLHDVGAISGPTEREVVKVGRFWVKTVEFVLASERGYIYGATRTLDLPVTPPTVLQDVPFNLVPHPSGELASGDVVVATNLSTNPSLEVNGNGWSGFVTTLTGTSAAGMSTHGRVTGELAASGSASFRSRLVGGSGSGSARLVSLQDVDISTVSVDQSISLSVWAALSVLGGTPSALRAIIEWRTATAAISSQEVTADGYAGAVMVLRSLRKPAGATIARIIIRGEFNWASGSDVRLYADALALTVP